MITKTSGISRTPNIDRTVNVEHMRLTDQLMFSETKRWSLWTGEFEAGLREERDMNLMSKGALTALTLALDFAAGSAVEQLWDADWFGAEVEEVRVVQTAPAPIDRIRTEVTAADIGRPQTGGGVCKPTERSVMVMAIEQLSGGSKATPRHVCIRALSGERELSAQFELRPSLGTKK